MLSRTLNLSNSEKTAFVDCSTFKTPHAKKMEFNYESKVSPREATFVFGVLWNVIISKKKLLFFSDYKVVIYTKTREKSKHLSTKPLNILKRFVI